MKKIGPVVALALLLLATPATAKEVSAAKLCGSSGCVDVKDHNTLLALQEGGDPVEPPLDGAPWYRAVLTVRAEDTREKFGIVVVPSERLIRAGGPGQGGVTWIPISGPAARKIAAAVGSIKPFPGPKLRGVGLAAQRQVRHGKVVLPEEFMEDESGQSSVWFGGAGAALLIVAGALGLRRRRRNDHS